MGNKISVMLAFVCNPFIAVLQKRLYLKYWKSEVDEVLINVNGRNDIIRKWIIDLWKQDDKVKFVDDQNWEMRQGIAFNNLYPHITGDIVVTMDSDNFIFKTGVITFNVQLITKAGNDCVGSLGYHAYPSSVAKQAIDKYGTVRLNPFFAIFKKEVLDTILDLTFGTYNYEAGEEFKPLGKIGAKGWMDVMARVSLEYMYRAPKFVRIPLHRDDEYIHVGAISSIFRRSYRTLEDTNTQLFEQTSDIKQQGFYLGWYKYIYNLTKAEIPFEEYKKEYEKGFDTEVNLQGIKIKDIDILVDSLAKKYKGKFD
jgi:hypothetical protein